MAELQHYTSIIEERIQGWLEGLSPEPLYDPVRYIMHSDGKRIRPALVLMAAEMFNGELDEAMPAALAIEIFHNFTLMHDDIMDEAPLRRGEITVHEKWGTSTAILSGDAMYTLANDQFTMLGSTIAMEMFKVFNYAALVVCEGQEEDMGFEERNDVSVQEYLNMIEKKTAELLAASLQLGAISAGGSAEEVQAMHDLGVSMGIAFQLQDDLLDAFADPKEIGKRQGGDIISNKKTFLLLSAYEQCDDDQRKRLAAAMQLSGDEKVTQVLSIFSELNVKELTLDKMGGYYEKASSLLDAFKGSEDLKAPLREILDRLAVRIN